MTKDNNKLGTFDLLGIPPGILNFRIIIILFSIVAPRGVPKIEVSF